MQDYSDQMTAKQAQTFRDDVLNIVSQIPEGRVTTYGTIAALAGWPSHSLFPPYYFLNVIKLIESLDRREVVDVETKNLVTNL